MATEPPTQKDQDKFNLLKSRKERFWIRLQTCYDMITCLPDDLDIFRVRASHVEKTREEFTNLMDGFSQMNSIHTDFRTDVLALTKAFDTLYYRIIAQAAKYPLTPNVASESNVTLPPIQLTKFNGSYESFPAFKALYDNLIHNSNLPNIKKFSYLLGYVEGSALKLLQTVTFSPDNYPIAYDLLVKRYTNQRLIANHHFSTILNLKSIKNNSTKTLRELVDILHSNVTSLKAMNIHNFHDYLLLEISLRLLDTKTRTRFESRHLDVDFPSFNDLVQFIRDQCDISDLSTAAPQSSSNNKSHFTFNDKSHDHKRISMGLQADNKTPIKLTCPLCSESHRLSLCPTFLAATAQTRHELVRKNKRCFSCLGSHNVSKCISKYSCRICGHKSHNTLLHFETEPRSSTLPPSFSEGNPGGTSVSLANSCSLNSPSYTLLGTAQVNILSVSGQWQVCRLLIDTGSQVNLITNSLVERLGLSRRKCPYDLKGVGQISLGHSQGLVSCSIAPVTLSEPALSFDAVVLPRITADLPTVPLPKELQNRFSSLKLADPDFHKKAPIDILLGVSTFLDISPATPALIKGSPSALLTSLGWVIMGTIPQFTSRSIVSMHAQIDSPNSLDTLLQSFWESEELQNKSFCSPEDAFCESFYSNTTTRDNSGRYITRLPFRDNSPPNMGCNRDIALNRFLSLETRFTRDPEFKKLYADNIQDYVAQGHLVPSPTTSPYILTHHGVKKLTSKGTQVRVVFNPAERDPKGTSLNDTLFSGPKLQTDIGEIITRFRLPQIALTCDIKQMFREISLHPADRKYQHIFWRFSSDQPLLEYEHTRVIFGATCSPFLAQRTIQQLVLDEGTSYPLAASALKQSIYVDDILTGADSEEEILALQKELIELFQKGGFKLAKWACSKSHLVSIEAAKLHDLSKAHVPIKVLGLAWNPKLDSFCYQIHLDKETPTKRGVLSRIARTYDVNGYLSPFIFTLKALMQQLWLLKIGWDDPLPSAIESRWTQILFELPLLEKITIPRCILSEGWISGRLIGFADASEIGMAAVVYLRLQAVNSISINLIASKTRVAPLKGWTIPRLELGAACLLSKLTFCLQQSLSLLSLDNPICFSDSSTALAWISTPPYRLKTFVANRVAQIHEHLPNVCWRHVPSKENPADAASRGLLPSQLLDHSLWWNGPSFLYEDEQNWPLIVAQPSISLPDLKAPVVQSHLTSLDLSELTSLFDRHSSLLKIQRIVAYLKRFAHNCRAKISKQSKLKPMTGFVTAYEYQLALESIIKITQMQYLHLDIDLIAEGKLCSKRYRSLTPFLSPHGFVMVGGRLRHSRLPERSRHPYLIPRYSQLANLLVDYFHIYSGHGGPKLVQSLLHRQYWIPSARDLIRKRIFKCLICYRFKATSIQPPMSDIPAYRLQPSRCFSHTGIDFAGPFLVKASLLRTTKSVKCYFALFVCMVTKAIHLEVTTDLTSDACLAALDRFISRRGLPSHIYTDQGRNFKGAAREISEISQFLAKSQENISQYLAARNVEWHFNPPYAPHFGGLWESGVKSEKHHFKRIVGTQILSLEEFTTVLTRIEGILNSRPLCALPNSPDDGFDYLTPGHFLTGGPILARPEASLQDVPVNRLTRWRLTQHLVQSFWRKWSREYLHTQLFRPKWIAPARELAVGDPVFWYAPGVLPTQWPKGRITELLPGPDGITRVVRVRTPTGEVLRPTNKVVPLPLF